MTASVVKRNIDFVARPGEQAHRCSGSSLPTDATTVANDQSADGRRHVDDRRTRSCSRVSARAHHLPERARRTQPARRGADGSGPYRLTRSSPATTTRCRAQGLQVGPRRRDHDGAAAAGDRSSSGSSRTSRPPRTCSSPAGSTSHGRRARPRAAREGRELFKTVDRRRRLGVLLQREHGTPGRQRRPSGKALVQALKLGQIGRVATSGRGVPMTQLTRQDVHAVRRELGRRAASRRYNPTGGAVGAAGPSQR